MKKIKITKFKTSKSHYGKSEGLMGRVFAIEKNKLGRIGG